MTDPDFREVYSAANAQDAHIIKAALADSGIEAQVVGELLSNAVGDLPSSSISPSVCVRSADFESARAAVDAQMEIRKADGNPAGKWTCPDCGEFNESTFDICWSCEVERKA